jgi:hypothetical protein
MPPMGEKPIKRLIRFPANDTSPAASSARLATNDADAMPTSSANAIVHFAHAVICSPSGKDFEQQRAMLPHLGV